MYKNLKELNLQLLNRKSSFNYEYMSIGLENMLWSIVVG